MNNANSMSMIIAPTFDKIKNGNVLELKISKINDHPRGVTLRSSHTENEELARADLTQWMEAIGDVARQAEQQQMKNFKEQQQTGIRGSDMNNSYMRGSESRSISTAVLSSFNLLRNGR